MTDHKKVLVYHHRPEGEPIVRSGLEIMKSSELESKLRDDSAALQLGRKAIPSGATHVEITPRSLLTPDQLRDCPRRPNDESNVASVRIPAAVFLSRATVGGYEELFIVSRKQADE